MNNAKLNEELKQIDDNYKSSFKKVNEINDISGNMTNLWEEDPMREFANKMKTFTEEMINLQKVFDEYESQVNGLSKINEKLENEYGKRK